MGDVLFVFAHQDDEVAAAPRIRLVVSEGRRAVVAFLTDGGGGGVRPEVRDAESREALATLGVHDVHFLGSRNAIPDGRLPENLDRALALLEEIAGDPDEVVTLAWEGGHQDHDAAHLVALAFATQRGLVCREVPLYHGRGLPGPLFRVASTTGEGWVERRIPARELVRDALLCRTYVSQRRTWAAILPLLLLGAMVRPREVTRVASVARVRTKPHHGKLFYERRFKYPWPRFQEAARAFIESRLSRLPAEPAARG